MEYLAADVGVVGEGEVAFPWVLQRIAEGAPFVTTDTAAAQKALELDADILMKATRVDGVYSADPEKDPAATLFKQLTYREVRDKNLKVMDSTAIAHCMEHELPILVFNYRIDGNIERAVRGEDVGTLVTSHAVAAK